MTRAAKLKKQIRARAAKTGESYTAARRQHLRRAAPAAPPPVSRASAGGLSDERCRSATGRSLADWYGVLDAFGALSRGHTDAARHLREEHGVAPWYSQAITVAYERTRGARAPNQKASGMFEVAVTRILPASQDEALSALAERARRRAWLAAVDPALARALEAGLRERGFTRRRSGTAHLHYRSGRTRVAIDVDALPDGRSRVAVTSARLESPDAVAEARGAWRAALDGLKRHLGPGRP